MKHIKFIKPGHCNALGNFGPGDTARVDDAFADHLVYDAGCAEFIGALPVEPTPVAVEPEVVEAEPVKRRGRKAAQ